jgi:hypothetical protein
MAEQFRGVKDSWTKVTVEEFLILEELEKDREISVLDRQIKTISLLTDSTEESIRRLTLIEIQEKYDKDFNFLNTPIRADLKDYYHIGNRKYKLIRDINQLTIGQYGDFDKLVEDRERVMEKIHLILTVFLIPCKSKTLIQKIIEKAGLYKWPETEEYLDTPSKITSEEIYYRMMVSDAMSICLFFCAVERTYSSLTEIYLQVVKIRKLLLVLNKLKTGPQTDETERLIGEINTIIDGIG